MEDLISVKCITTTIHIHKINISWKELITKHVKEIRLFNKTEIDVLCNSSIHKNMLYRIACLDGTSLTKEELKFIETNSDNVNMIYEYSQNIRNLLHSDSIKNCIEINLFERKDTY